jgi:hypothetical protein
MGGDARAPPLMFSLLRQLRAGVGAGSAAPMCCRNLEDENKKLERKDDQHSSPTEILRQAGACSSRLVALRDLTEPGYLGYLAEPNSVPVLRIESIDHDFETSTAANG